MLVLCKYSSVFTLQYDMSSVKTGQIIFSAENKSIKKVLA